MPGATLGVSYRYTGLTFGDGERPQSANARATRCIPIKPTVPGVCSANTQLNPWLPLMDGSAVLLRDTGI